jgi:hypothetical protein
VKPTAVKPENFEVKLELEERKVPVDEIMASKMPCYILLPQLIIDCRKIMML